MTSITTEDLDALREALADNEKPGSEKTLAGVNEMVERLSSLRDKKKLIEDELSTVNIEIEGINRSLVDLLVQHELSSYRAPAGLVTVAPLFNAKLPQGPDKTTFFDYLKERGDFDRLASIHSATFTSYIKEQYELARERGEGEPKIPGVSEVKTLLRLSFRKSK